MIDLDTERPSWMNARTTRPTVSESGAVEKKSAEGRIHWSLSDSVLLPGMKEAPAKYPFAALGSMKPNPRLMGDDEVMKLRPLATPLMARGFSPKILVDFWPILLAYGLVPLQAGGGGAVASVVS